MKLTLLLFAFVALAAAQSTAISVSLTWADTINPPTVSYNVYRAPASAAGDCAAVTYAKIAGPLTAKAYQDSLATSGTYCYTVTATLGTRESAKSLPLVWTILAPPTGLSAQ